MPSIRSNISRITVTVFAWLPAATSVALGAIYMLVAGAPQRYILVNAAALAVGVIAASLLRRAPLRDRTFAGASTIAIGLVRGSLPRLRFGGRYRLVAPVGTGGSAHVYVADDTTLRRRVFVVRCQVADRVVAPVVSQAAIHQPGVLHELVHR